VHVGLLGGGEVQLADGEPLLLLAAGELGSRGELSFNAFALCAVSMCFCDGRRRLRTYEAALAATAEAVAAFEAREIEASIRGE
jgi:hypothetical protein